MTANGAGGFTAAAETGILAKRHGLVPQPPESPDPMTPPRLQRRIAAIGGMRGIASLMVACHHFNGALGTDLASIALAVGLLALGNAMNPEAARPLPSLGSLAAHVVYLQRILGYEHIVIVYWSLCFEVQMYLLYVVLRFLAVERPTMNLSRRIRLLRRAEPEA